MDMAIDLSAVEVALLDLDGTLYSSALNIEGKILPSSRATVARELGMSIEEAIPIIWDLNQRYGYFVRGLAIEYDLDPEYLIDEIYRPIDRSGIEGNAPLHEALKKLAGVLPVHIVTNSGRVHAQEVLKLLDLDAFITTTISIEDLGFFLKPDPESFNAVESILDVPLRKMAYFDDSMCNIREGWMLGMSCVLVSNGMTEAPYFWENHLKVKHLAPDHVASTHDLPGFLEHLLEGV